MLVGYSKNITKMLTVNLLTYTLLNAVFLFVIDSLTVLEKGGDSQFHYIFVHYTHLLLTHI